MIDCYRLAHWYKQDPLTFLSLPLSTVQLHVYRTAQLQRIMAQERRNAEEPD